MPYSRQRQSVWGKMRVLLKIRTRSNSPLTINYNYALSAAIYKLLRFGSKDFAEFLHNIGYKNAGKTYKLFSFALRFDKFKIQNQTIHLIEPTASLIISSPLVEDFIQSFIIGTFEEQQIEIFGTGIKTIFTIEQIESLPSISFQDKMKFILLSPVVLSTKQNFNGKLHQYYFRYNDSIEEINRVLNGNLKNKFELIHNKAYEGEGVKISWDENYIKRMTAKKKRLTKKITIRKNELINIDVIGNQLPFEIEGDTELIEIGYECGFGEKNSLGFGLVETN